MPLKSQTAPAIRLAGALVVGTIGYCLLVGLFYRFDITAIKGLLTPFWASWRPGGWSAIKWSLRPLAILGFTTAVLHRSGVFRFMADRASARVPDRRLFLVGAYLFLIGFSCAIAMMRGPSGIVRTYERPSWEFVGDIGAGGSIRGLFARYAELHPDLSLHARVHPPGPIALLWMLSWLVGRSPLALALATIAVGSLAVFPLYAWIATLFGDRAATAGLLLYALMPSVVLFTATTVDVMFLPFTVFTLLAFDRAIRFDHAGWAVAAGVGYAVMTLLKFTLIGVGTWFALVGLLFAARVETRGRVIRTAAVMVLALIAVHVAVWAWSGYDYIGNLRICKQWLDEKLVESNAFVYYPGWVFRIGFNPLSVLWFAGLPVSTLFVAELVAAARRCRTATLRSDTSGAVTPVATVCLIFLTLIALNFQYLGRGEAERSALYVLPFMVAVAGHGLATMCAQTRSANPLAVALGFLALQTWVTEFFLYTSW